MKIRSFFVIIALVMQGGIANAQTEQQQNEQSAATSQPVVEPLKSNWIYSEEKDEMRNKTSYYAFLNSSNEVDFGYPYSGGSFMMINLRDSSRYGKDVIFSISKGMFSCGYRGCTIAVKFDDGEIINYKVVEAESGRNEILFIANDNTVSQFVKRLRASQVVIIEARFYDEGPRQFKFDSRGLEWGRF